MDPLEVLRLIVVWGGLGLVLTAIWTWVMHIYCKHNDTWQAKSTMKVILQAYALLYMAVGFVWLITHKM